jgi:hypothetical protein
VIERAAFAAGSIILEGRTAKAGVAPGDRPYSTLMPLLPTLLRFSE